MTAVMDRRKSLGLAKSSNRPVTTFKEEDEHQDDIYGARSRDVRNIELYLPVYFAIPLLSNQHYSQLKSFYIGVFKPWICQRIR